VPERDPFICQPAACIRTSSHRRCQLDLTVNRSFDHDLSVLVAKAGLRFAAIPRYLANSPDRSFKPSPRCSRGRVHRTPPMPTS
jgi:hypothetical protein